jgi:flagellar motor switch protein FliN/FliY
MRDWLFSQWSEKLASILESMADVRPTFEPRPASVEAPAAGSFFWRQSFSFSADAFIDIATDRSTCVDLGARTLKAAGIESNEEADAQNTFLEILVQSFSALNRSVAEHLDTRPGATDGEQLDAMPEDAEWICFPFQCDGVALEPFWLSCSRALLDTLGSGPTAAVKPAVPAEAAPQPVAAAPDSAVGGSKTFDVMLDVSLPVSISFGRTFLPIKDVLKLNSGSIVELDRGVSEPVEVIVNNCVIARGEVVVIEGNYGVRIQQIASRYDRLRTGTSATQVQHGGGGKPQ